MATYQYDPITGTYILVDDPTTGVTTDQPDYAPGTVATLTATSVTVGGTVEFIVAHENAGADGIIGTADDFFTYDLDGTGTPWFVTDGGQGDLDGVANGTVVTSWNVNWDASNQAFVVSAIDLSTGASATTAFTDAVHFDPVEAVANDSFNGLIFDTAGAMQETGTGNFPSFVQLQGGNNDYDGVASTEQGYNPYNPPLEDSGSSPTFNHAIQVSQVPTETIDGQTYLVFRLDLNEPNTSVAGTAVLEQLKLFVDGNGQATPDTDGLPTGASLIYDLDGNGDTSITLADWSSGSGHGDYVVKIPVGALNPNDYIYLFSQFSGAEGGFEEWAMGTAPVSPPPPPPPPPAPHATLFVDKDVVCPDDSTEIISNGLVLTGSDVKFVYSVTATDDDVSGVVVLDDNGTPGDTSDDLSTTAGTITYVSGDDGDGILEVGETWTYISTSVLAREGQYTNNVTVNGTSVQDQTAAGEGFATSGYYGVNPQILVDKQTNGVDGKPTGLNLIEGQVVTWTYDVTLGDGNVDLTNITVTDVNDATHVGQQIYLAGDTNHNGVKDDSEDWTASGDSNNDGVLEAGETWHFVATSTAGAAYYSNTVTVTGDTYIDGQAITEDGCGNSLIATATDTSDYTGHARGLEGLTKGFWATHLTLWDVKTGDEKGSGTEINVAPKYDYNKSGGITLSDLTTTGPASGVGGVKGGNNGGGDSGLLMGDLNHDGLITGEGSTCHLFLDLASAQTLANSSVSGDARIILASQAVAAQLNQYNAWVDSGGFDSSPNGLIDEAVQWLLGKGPLGNTKSSVDTNIGNDLANIKTVISTAAGSDYTLKSGAITFSNTALSSSDDAWQKKAVVFSEATSNIDYNGDGDFNDYVCANGEGLKNALAAYNHGLSGTTAGFVTSEDGSLIGWEDSLGGTPYDVHANDKDVFWAILAQHNITGVDWHNV